VNVLASRAIQKPLERDYEDLKQEIGLGRYEGRGWCGSLADQPETEFMTQ
jgi:hypothetical protein